MTFLGHIRKEVTKQTGTKFQKTGKSRVTTKIWLAGAEAAGAINRWGHLNRNLDELLKSEYGPAW